jgi:hypothetical protein
VARFISEQELIRNLLAVALTFCCMRFESQYDFVAATDLRYINLKKIRKLIIKMINFRNEGYGSVGSINGEEDVFAFPRILQHGLAGCA